MTADRLSLRHRFEDAALRALLGLARAVPYRRRIPMMGWVASRIAAPVLGWDRRVRDNLAHVRPDLPASEVRRLVRAVPDNAGRTFAELYAGQEFVDHVGDTELAGPGCATLEACLRDRRPMILVTGHIGNYDAFRAVMKRRGVSLAALYRPLRNPAINAHYSAAIGVYSEVQPAQRKGIATLLRHLRQGGPVAVVSDIYAKGGLPVTFFGKTAPTAGTIAEWALKFDAPLIPVFCIRNADGLSFTITVEEPIPHGTVEQMMQTYNDRVEAQARAHMDQWFWIHRRWKPGRQRTRSAATTGP